LPRPSERHLIIGGLFFFAFWLFVALPFFYTIPRYERDEVSKCAGEESKNHGFWEKTKCDPTAYFTLWLVAFTGVLAASTIGLWIVTARGVRNQTADTRVLQRAYLNVLPLGIETTRAGAVAGQILIRNAGNLPARKVSTSVRIGHFDGRTEVDFDDGVIPQHTIVLPAGAEMPRGSGALQDGRSLLTGRQGYIYVWGRVTYEDGFGVDRWLTFCHRYPCATAEGSFGSERIAAGNARHHHEHNDGD
jgi:hypothetical protein